MTVCIAALCRDGSNEPRVVVAADHMVTAGGLMEYEHPGQKMVELSDHAIVMVSGDALNGMRIANDAAADGVGSADIASIADDLGQRYAAARLQRAEQAILSTRGLTLESFYGMHNSLQGQAVMLLDQALGQYDLGVELLLAGVDETGAHIHTNHNPGGGNLNHDPIGYAAIGSGAIHVVPSMAGFAHSAAAPFDHTLFRVYASKRRAEVAPGVGRDTDVVVVGGGDGVKKLSSDELERLGSIYDEFVSKSDAELRKLLDDFDPRGRQLMARTDVQPLSPMRAPGKDAEQLDPQAALSLALIESELVQVYAQGSSAWARIEVPRDVSPLGCEAKRT